MKCANGMSVEKGQAYASFVEEETSLVVVVIKSPDIFNFRVSLIRRKRKQEARSSKNKERSFR